MNKQTELTAEQLKEIGELIETHEIEVKLKVQFHKNGTSFFPVQIKDEDKQKQDLMMLILASNTEDFLTIMGKQKPFIAMISMPVLLELEGYKISKLKKIMTEENYKKTSFYEREQEQKEEEGEEEKEVSKAE